MVNLCLFLTTVYIQIYKAIFFTCGRGRCSLHKKGGRRLGTKHLPSVKDTENQALPTEPNSSIFSLTIALMAS